MFVSGVRGEIVKEEEAAAILSVESLVLGKAPHLRAVYELDAGVFEGYSVLEHSQMVVERAIWYREEIEPRLPESLPFDRFILFLALHDAGKGVGHREVAAQFKTPMNLKRAECDATILLMEINQNVLGITDEELGLFRAMVEHDTIGTYLKNEIGFSAALDRLSQGAIKAKIELSDFVTLMDLYHRCDAGAYPRLEVLLFDYFDRKEEGREKIQSLVDHARMIETGSTVLQSVECFTQSSAFKMIETYQRELHVYARFVNLHLLLDDDAEEMIEAIILKMQSLFQTAGVKSLFLTTAQSEEVDLATFYREAYLEKAEWILSSLAIAVSQLRRDFIVRFRKKTLGLEPLHMVRWLHGTSALMLPMLSYSAKSLMCTGTLMKNGIWPLTGEQKWGCGVGGISMSSLSGVAIERGSKAIIYATKMHPTFDLEEGKKVIESYLSQKYESYEEAIVTRLFKGNRNYDLDLFDQSIRRHLIVLATFLRPYFECVRADLIEAVEKRVGWLEGLAEKCFAKANEKLRKYSLERQKKWHLDYQKKLIQGAEKEKVKVAKSMEEAERRCIELNAEIESLKDDEAQSEKLAELTEEFTAQNMTQKQLTLKLSELEDDISFYSRTTAPPLREPEPFLKSEFDQLAEGCDAARIQLNEFLSFLKSDMIISELDETMDKVGVVFGSSTIIGVRATDSVIGERIVSHPMLLGRDISVAYLSEVTPPITKFLGEMDVKVLPMDDLVNAYNLELANRTLLYDIMDTTLPGGEVS